MTTRALAVLALTLTILIGAAGCGAPIPFPSDPADAGDIDAYRAYDVNADGQPDWYLLADANGHVDRIAYDRHNQGKVDRIIELGFSRPSRSRHLVIILDGPSSALIREFYADGGLRLFHPPSHVVSPYPSMTDLCLSHILDAPHPPGFQARTFSHHRNRIEGGPIDYLTESNEPHFSLFHYTAPGIWRASAYVMPEDTFRAELARANEEFWESTDQEFIAYFGSAAAMGTRYSTQGHRDVMALIEQWVNYVVWRSYGTVNVTILADHGHPYTPSRRWPVAKHLEAKGWDLREKLTGAEREAVHIKFGLATFATFATADPAGLADALVGCEGLDIVNYAEGDRVIVVDRNGNKAAVAQRDGKFAYQPIQGDPLKLNEILASVPADADGFRDAEDLLLATAHHVYPAPLQRLWEGHFALAHNPPDLICSLDNDYFSGSETLAVVEIASTHGNLDQLNSTTFIMSTIGPLPEILRSKDIPAAMSELLDAPFWPMRR